MNTYLYFFNHFRLKSKGITLAFGVRINQETGLEGKNYIGRSTRIEGSKIGFASYIGSNSILSGCKIGKYCSIGSGVHVVNGFHPISDFVSTHPCFYSLKTSMNLSYVTSQKFEEFRFSDGRNSVNIGNDVWIGNDVLLIAGITIGNGAVIGAGAVVTKDVKPYSVAAGVPAKHIKSRFPDGIIDRLETIAWWDKDEKWIRDRADTFDNIDLFLQSVGDCEMVNDE